MSYLGTQAPNRPILPAIIAGVALILAGAFSVGGVNAFDFRFGFGFFPLIVIAIWPRQAHSLVSLLLIFFAGVFTDWATGGIVGQHALILTVIWGVMRPELRSGPYALLSFLPIWVAACGLAIVLYALTGRFVYGVWPDYYVFVREMLAATVLIPIILLLRARLAVVFSDGEEWDR